MFELLRFISWLLTIYSYVLIAAIIFNWLYVFNVINSGSQFVTMVGRFLYQATEPVLRPIRRILPDMGGIDISPIIVFIGIFFIQSVVIPNIARAFL